MKRNFTNQERLEINAMLNNEIDRRQADIKKAFDRGEDILLMDNHRRDFQLATWRFAGMKTPNSSLAVEIHELERTAADWQKLAGKGSFIEAKIIGRKIAMIQTVIFDLKNEAAPVGEQQQLF